ncbi:MAG: phospholipid-binding protein [Snowella sp.]|nr:phospholipid-binding protein [Snowella sp.]
MSFLSKLFGKEEETKAAEAGPVAVQEVAQAQSIPAHKVGLDGKFDESGLAKRVAKALDDADISDHVGLWVAQSESTVVLRYNEDAESVLEQAKTVAGNVEGATGVTAEPNT